MDSENLQNTNNTNRRRYQHFHFIVIYTESYLPLNSHNHSLPWVITTGLYLFRVYPCMKWPPNEVHKPVGGCGYTKWMHPAVLHDYNSLLFHPKAKMSLTVDPPHKRIITDTALCYRLQCIPVNAELQKPMPDPKMFSLHSRQCVWGQVGCVKHPMQDVCSNLRCTGWTIALQQLEISTIIK